MIHKLLSARLFFLVFVFLSSASIASDFPKNFFINYQAFQLEQDGGLIDINYTQKNNVYSIIAKTEFKGILKIFGDREFISEGIIDIKQFKPYNFEHKNKLNENKNIHVKFHHDKKKLSVNYKKSTKDYDLGEDYQDLLSFLLQFNFEEKKDHYKFNVVEGRRLNTYVYKKLKTQPIHYKGFQLNADLFEGNIEGRKNSTHYIWLANSKYRLPIKIKVKTKVGLPVEIKMIDTNLEM